MGFQKYFVGGAATISYQIEGAAFEDGKGLSIWDVYAHQPGKVFEGHNGDVACDHYHRFEEDVKLMKQRGIKAVSYTHLDVYKRQVQGQCHRPGLKRQLLY